MTTPKAARPVRLWLVYGLSSSSLGVRLVLDETAAKTYAANGFDVEEVVTTKVYSGR